MSGVTSAPSNVTLYLMQTVHVPAMHGMPQAYEQERTLISWVNIDINYCNCYLQEGVDER